MVCKPSIVVSGNIDNFSCWQAVLQVYLVLEFALHRILHVHYHNAHMIVVVATAVSTAAYCLLLEFYDKHYLVVLEFALHRILHVRRHHAHLLVESVAAATTAACLLAVDAV